MEYPKVIEKIILKEGSTYEELRQIIIDNIQEVEQDLWEFEIDKLKFPIKLSDNEVFEFLEFFFLHEYDKSVYVNIYTSEGKIVVECDRCFEGSMLAFISIFTIGIITLIVMILK